MTIDPRRSNDILIQLEKHTAKLKKSNKTARKKQRRFSAFERFIAGSLLCACPLFLFLRIKLWGPGSDIIVSALAFVILFYMTLLRLSGFTGLMLDTLQTPKVPGLPRATSARAAFARKHICEAGMTLLGHSTMALEEAKQIASFNFDDLRQALTALGVLSAFAGLIAFKAQPLITMGFPQFRDTSAFLFVQSLDPFPVFLVILSLSLWPVMIAFQPFRWNKFKAAINYAIVMKAHLVDDHGA